MKGSSNFGDTQSLEEHALYSLLFLSKAEAHCAIVLISKSFLGWGEQSVTQHVIVLLRITE